VIRGYTVVNASFGVRSGARWELYAWARNLFDRDYMQNYTVQAGNSGLIVGTPNDPRTVGFTARVAF
jgi:iron complex outermembrane receptor protein